MSFRRRLCGILCAGVTGLAAAACSTSSSTFRETVGLDQPPPDEFLVVSKAPLVVPPDMALRPPAPGAPALNSSDPRMLAQSTITGSTAGARSGTSAGEQSMLARAGATGADPNIRAELLREEGVETKDSTLVERLAIARRNQGEVLDPYAEQGQVRTQPVAQPATPGAPTSIVLEDILSGSASTN